jgi:hypothetical protein
VSGLRTQLALGRRRLAAPTEAAREDGHAGQQHVGDHRERCDAPGWQRDRHQSRLQDDVDRAAALHREYDEVDGRDHHHQQTDEA